SFTQDDTPAPAAEDLESPKFWETPLFLDIAKILGGLIVLLVLVLSVIRPLVKHLIVPAAQPLSMLPRAATAATAAPPDTPALVNTSQKAATAQEQIVQARVLAGQDPKRAAQVVRGWVAADE